MVLVWALCLSFLKGLHSGWLVGVLCGDDRDFISLGLDFRV